MHKHVVLVGIALGVLSACGSSKPSDKDKEAAAAAASAEAAREQKHDAVVGQLAVASAQVAQATAEIGKAYAEGRAQAKVTFDAIDHKTAAAKAKLPSLTGAKKKAADAALAEYEKQKAAASTVLGQMPETQPDTVKAEATMNGVVPALDAMDKAAKALEAAAK